MDNPSNLEQQAQKRYRVHLVIAAILVVIIILFITQIGVYTIQPIGAVPEGRTVIVWRGSGEPFFNSADGACLRTIGHVSILCRLTALGNAPTDRIIVRLPYQRWAYLLSTDGKEFEK